MITRYVANRLLQSVVVLFGAIAISFALTNLIGKPADVIGGAYMSQEQRDALNVRLGYDKPLLTQFVDYLKSVATGKFGISYRDSEPAAGHVLAALPNTVVLVVTAMLVAALIAMVLAVFSTRHREDRWDRALRRSIGMLQGMPEFWLALMLVLIFSVEFELLPSFGFTSASALILPAASLSLPIIPTLFRVFRGQLLDVMSGEMVQAMRGRGLSERVILYRHALRNIAGPSSTFAALQLGYLIGHCLIVESIFAWPGIGNLMVSSVQARDFAVVQAIIVVVAALFILLNLAADLVVLITDPRVRVGAS